MQDSVFIAVTHDLCILSAITDCYEECSVAWQACDLHHIKLHEENGEHYLAQVGLWVCLKISLNRFSF